MLIGLTMPPVPLEDATTSLPHQKIKGKTIQRFMSYGPPDTPTRGDKTNTEMT